MLDDGEWSRSNESFILEMRNTMIVSCLDRDLDVIVDDTNLAPMHIESIKKIGNMMNAEIEVRFFELPLHEAIMRDSRREKSVGQNVIVDMFNKYLKPKIEYNPELFDAIIVDIDGTLAKMNGRGPYEWGRVNEDLVNNPIADIVDNCKGIKILVSGRSDECRRETEEWLLVNNITYDYLYMRPAAQLMEKDTVIKKEIYDKYIAGKYNIQFVLDDRDQVVHMWRGLGLTCLQVDYGNF